MHEQFHLKYNWRSLNSSFLEITRESPSTKNIWFGKTGFRTLGMKNNVQGLSFVAAVSVENSCLASNEAKNSLMKELDNFFNFSIYL